MVTSIFWLDGYLDLDTLLIKLRGKVNTQLWYQFGLTIGVPKDFLENINGYPEEECMIEIADYWLRNHPDQPTWQDITDAVEKVQNYGLANGIYDLAGETNEHAH